MSSTPRIASILVGTDGSDTAGIAVTQAIELARSLGARLQIVSAYEPVPGAPGSVGPPGTSTESGGRVRLTVSPEWTVHVRDEVLALLQSARADAEAAGVAAEEIETFARVGDAADAILDVAEEQGCDLIVVGHKGMTGATRFLLGSVPNKVSHHAPCSVLIVRTG